MSDLSPTDVAKWMREQASRFNAMAEEIERTFHIAPINLTRTLELNLQMQNVLSDARARRAPELAADLGVTPEEVTQIALNDQVFARNERGWITLAGQQRMAADG